MGVILFNFLLDTIANNTSHVLRFCNVKEVEESLNFKKLHVVIILAQWNQNFWFTYSWTKSSCWCAFAPTCKTLLSMNFFFTFNSLKDDDWNLVSSSVLGRSHKGIQFSSWFLIKISNWEPPCITFWHAL
jgi:hypothetical protein